MKFGIFFILIIFYFSFSNASPEACIKLYNSQTELFNTFEENVYAIHITDFLSSNGIIHATTKDRGRFSTTIHFSLGEPVMDHHYGSWSEKPYAVIMPIKYLKDQILNLFPQDTFVLGSVKLPNEAVVFVPVGTKIPNNNNFKVVQYEPENGVKAAISKYLNEINSIQFHTPNAMGSETFWNGYNILDKNRLKKLFKNILADRPFISMTSHDFTPWGKIDYLIIDLLFKWISKENVSMDLDMNIKLAYYNLLNLITETERIASQMKLPLAAKNNYQENLSELKSYLNLIEAEKNLRTKGLSILSIHPKENLDLVTKIQSLRYNKQTLNAFIESIQDQLPRFTPDPNPGNYVSYQPSILKERPSMFLEAMKSTPIETFKKILLENFPNPDEQTSGEIREAILSLVISQLKAGLISYKVALDYFLPEIDFLFDRKNMVGLFGISYVVIGEDKREKIILHYDLLRFLQNPKVHAYLQSKDSFKYFNEKKNA